MPAIRRSAKQEDNYHLASHLCPFCGSEALLNSIGDRTEDPLRNDLYCDNGWCDVREFAVITMRTDANQAGKRADVKALTVIDRGTETEMETDGFELHRDAEGKLESYSIAAGTSLDRPDHTVHRRTRNAQITIEPR